MRWHSPHNAKDCTHAVLHRGVSLGECLARTAACTRHELSPSRQHQDRTKSNRPYARRPPRRQPHGCAMTESETQTPSNNTPIACCASVRLKFLYTTCLRTWHPHENAMAVRSKIRIQRE